MKKYCTIIIVFFALIPVSQILSQNVSDTALPAFGIGPAIAFHIPHGDMADRFGNSGAIGGHVFYKTAKNWFLGVDAHYISSGNVKEDHLLDRITTEEGHLISGNGINEDVYFRQSGIYTGIKAGKIFSVLDPNPNSGLIFIASGGFLQHKIKIDNPNNTAYQLKDEYKKGYDRLSNGFAMSEFIGYYHMSNSKMVNFYVGFEFIQGWTKNRRSYDFYKMKKMDKNRMDLLNGLKFGWFFPIYNRVPDDFYYY